MPLKDSNVPLWATRLRQEAAKEIDSTIGTSLLIPAPDSYPDDLTDKSFWFEVKRAVFASFTYAIYSGKLEVCFQDEPTLTANNCRTLFQAFVDDPNFKRMKAVERESIEPALTILNPNEHGALVVAGMGSVSYFLRLGTENIPLTKRAVAIARRSGMLITRQADRLKALNDFERPFDLFLCVTDDEGSSLLRDMEGPRHTELEITRLSKEQKPVYRKFTDQIRTWLAEHVNEGSESAVAGGLGDLGESVLGDEPENPDVNEEGQVVVRGSFSVRVLPTTRAKIRVNPDTPGDGQGQGGGAPAKSPGKGGGKSKVGSSQRPNGTRIIEGKGAVAAPISNLRVIPEINSEVQKAPEDDCQLKQVSLKFEPTKRGKSYLYLYVSGEQQKHPMTIWIERDGVLEKKDKIEFVAESLGKRSEKVWLDSDLLKFALEADVFSTSEVD